MKQTRQGNSLLWWCVLGTSVVAHGLWLYVCSDSMLAMPLSQTPTVSAAPLTLQFVQMAPAEEPSAQPSSPVMPSAKTVRHAPAASVAAAPIAKMPEPVVAAQHPAEAQEREPAGVSASRHAQVTADVQRLASARLAQTSPVITSAPDYLAPPAAPEYPPMARKRGWEGKVWLEIPVSAQGLSGEPVVLRSSGFELLDRAAITAALQWRFRPEQRAGRPVDTRVQVPVAFALR